MQYLSSSDFELYKTMIGRDNWCIHFDKEERKCNQYESRPLFCKVDKKSYKKMFGIDEEDFNDFCNFCCREQIQDVYGEDSDEMNRFNNVALALELELDADMDEDEKN
jgi:Fe-S-cluster containining protein